MSDDNVIDFESELRKQRERGVLEPGLAIAERPTVNGRRCYHRHVEVGEASVSCADCKAPLDAHQLLLQYANEERSFLFACEKARTERKRLEEELASVERKVKNAKARLRRVTGQLEKAGAIPLRGSDLVMVTDRGRYSVVVKAVVVGDESLEYHLEPKR